MMAAPHSGEPHGKPREAAGASTPRPDGSALFRGDHHVFGRDDVQEIANAQPERSMAKAYQVRQFLKLIERHGLPSEEDDGT